MEIFIIWTRLGRHTKSRQSLKIQYVNSGRLKNCCTLSQYWHLKEHISTFEWNISTTGFAISNAHNDLLSISIWFSAETLVKPLSLVANSLTLARANTIPAFASEWKRPHGATSKAVHFQFSKFSCAAILKLFNASSDVTIVHPGTHITVCSNFTAATSENIRVW